MKRHLIGRTSPIGWAAAGVLLSVVVGVTLAVGAHRLPLSFFAASAARIAAGEIWLVPLSAFVVDRPVYVGLLAFCLIGFAALRVCGTRVFWLAAAVGHIGSTLVVYAIIGGARLTDPDAFSGAVAMRDFGVSAMQGAWVGAIAATAWTWTRRDPRARTVVAAGVCAVAGVGWWLHPDPSILTTEHLFAFLAGCGVVFWPGRAASARPAARSAVAHAGKLA